MSAVAAADPTASVHGLPHYLTTFIGRADDLRSLRSLLAGARLVTLTGPGGVGKTRLAAQLVGTSNRKWPDGVWWVDLAPVDELDQVAGAVAAALQLPRTFSSLDAISSRLATGPVGLILDTCEHVLPACARLTADLIRQCPQLTLIATSREPLGVHGEAIWPVASMAPDDAISLFEQRGRLVYPQFKVGLVNRDVVAEICRRLDGMPLAIELAATRLGLMNEPEILSRLADRFQLLTTTSQTLPWRQKTMAATIDWSYGLLTEDEARLFRRLAVFRGGFSLEAAEAIGGENAAPRVLDLLASLIQKSLVVAQRIQAERTRYRLLDSMLAYAEERLRESGESELVRRRHYEYFHSALSPHIVHTVGPRARDQSIGASDEEWKARESANLWAAVTWARHNTEDMGLSLAYDMAETQHGDLPRVTALLLDLLANSSVQGAPRVKATARASSISIKLGDNDRALALAETSLSLARELRDPELIGKTLAMVGECQLARGDPDAALALSKPALAMLEETPNRTMVLHLRFLIAWAKLEQGEAAAAAAALRQVVAESRLSKGASQLGWFLPPLGWAQLGAGELEAADASFREALAICRGLKDRHSLVWSLQGLAALASARTDDVRALRLAGTAARAAREWSLATFNSSKVGGATEPSRVRLGRTGSEKAWEAGWALGVERGIDYALADHQVESPADRGPLSRRESDVAKLVASGMANRQIADRLFISERTAEGHIERIRNKLGVHSRTEIAVWAVEHRLTEWPSS